MDGGKGNSDMISPKGKNWIDLSNLRICLVACSAITLIAGCKTPQACCDRGHVKLELENRTSQTLPPSSCPGEILFPPFVTLDDGLTEDEAIATALWNNRDFHATLANLGIARGDLVQAGLLTNPQLNLLFPPIGSKQLEWTLYTPLEAIILRRTRIEIAERDLQRICNELIQYGLNVARDARVAFADLQFATDRYKLAQEAVKVRHGLAELAQKRLEAGDIGELEVINTRLDANRTRAEAAGLERAIRVAEVQLKFIMGISNLDTHLSPVAGDVRPVPPLDEDALVAEAVAIRPDLKAARIAILAAQHRVELARKSFLRIDAVADGNHEGAGPSNVGPGLRFEIPIFNRNQGLILRSRWSVDQANHNYYSVHDRAITEVRTSIANIGQANSNLQILREKVLPALNESVRLSESAYGSGGDTYFLVLQSTSQFIDSQIRELELIAALRRASAELDRSVGRRVIYNTPSEVLLPIPEPATELKLKPVPQTDLLPPVPVLNANHSDSKKMTPLVTVIVVQPSVDCEKISPDMIAKSLCSAATQMTNTAVKKTMEFERKNSVTSSAVHIEESAFRWQKVQSP
ncbi:TolC family protein [Calycomorphotria hydatis]|uniref:Cobalt-zinc-cadmium resistance protein CzcC n=1 Tax=Calycomorphotria hydatis TaxID=2528027 RepID=A0A517TE35_9PLAN|nr:TolC family protein [Calycomorphotria hydatis]QDT66634.1 Cobalt-zinc-cadmium resistance protein CzcC precursor [Calycomorphotria hydatis]